MDLSSVTELAVIVGLTEMIKGLIPETYRDNVLPLLAVFFGVGIHLLLFEYTPLELVNGLILGLSATGLYRAGNAAIDRAVQ